MDDLLGAIVHERALLGLCLVHGAELLPALAGRLKPSHFGHVLHRRLWAAILAVHQAAGPVEPMTVAGALASADLSAIGGLAGLSGLYDGSVSPEAQGELLRVLDDRSARRRAYGLGEQIRRAAVDPDQPAGLLAARARVALDALEAANGPATDDGRSTIAWEDAEEEEIPWVMFPLIPDLALTMFAGREGSGKSLMTVKMAACLSNGVDLLGRPLASGPVRSLLVNAEDSPAVTSQRLAAAGARRGMVHIFRTDIDGFELSERWLGKISDSIQKNKIKAAFLDPIVKMSDGIDFNSQTAVQGLLSPFADLGVELKCGMVVVAHHNKSKDILGSVAFRTAVRSVLQVYRDPASDDYAYLTQSKSNYSRLADSVRFKVEGFEERQPRIEILGESRKWTYRMLKECELDDRDLYPVKSAEDFLRRSVARFAKVSLRQLHAMQKEEAVLFGIEHLRKAIFRLGMEHSRDIDRSSESNQLVTFIGWPDDSGDLVV